MRARTLTRALGAKIRNSRVVDVLTRPYGVNSYTELVNPTWTAGAARAKVVTVTRSTPRSVTLRLAPNAVFAGFRAGQHVNLTVEIDGRRHTRCYSPASAQDDALVELTIGVHDEGVVSTHLFGHARPGMVVGLDGVSGDFTLPTVLPPRILFVSGGSGITPVLSMLRTLHAQAARTQIGFLHYARSAEDACYRAELAALDKVDGLRVRHGYPRAGDGYFGPDHVEAVLPDPGAVYVCGPPTLIAAVSDLYPGAHTERFVPHFLLPTTQTGGTVTFTDSKIAVASDGRSLLEQAEGAGLTPYSGCRMGICRTCTRRKTRGAVQNLLTGAVSSSDDEDIQICTSVPLGDVAVAL